MSRQLVWFQHLNLCQKIRSKSKLSRCIPKTDNGIPRKNVNSRKIIWSICLVCRNLESNNWAICTLARFDQIKVRTRSWYSTVPWPTWNICIHMHTHTHTHIYRVQSKVVRRPFFQQPLVVDLYFQLQNCFKKWKDLCYGIFKFQKSILWKLQRLTFYTVLWSIIIFSKNWHI